MAGIVNEELLEEFRCSLCHGYLSCGPVRVLPDGSSICGRCTPSNITAPIYRVLAFEAALSSIRFPCSYKRNGCTESFLFGQTANHEAKCSYRTFGCPLLSFVSCSWEGPLTEIFNHFTEIHSELINQEIRFKLKIDQNVEEMFMVMVDGIPFIFKYLYNHDENELKYDLRYCEFNDVEDVTYKIQLINDLDAESNINLKSQKCVCYDYGFSEFQNATVLNLNKFYECLDKPNSITIGVTINLKVTECTPDNFDALEMFRCPKCQWYLIPPLFTLQGKTVCCDCVKRFGEGSTPLLEGELKNRIIRANYPCRWTRCEYVTKSNMIKTHESLCEFGQFKCIYEICNLSCTLAETKIHLEQHNAKYMPDNLFFNTSFLLAYEFTRIFTIKDNVITFIEHSVEESLRLRLFTRPDKYRTVNLTFQHDHCKVKSKTFTLNTLNVINITLNDLPYCFRKTEKLLVTVHI